MDDDEDEFTTFNDKKKKVFGTMKIETLDPR